MNKAFFSYRTFMNYQERKWTEIRSKRHCKNHTKRFADIKNNNRL